MKQKITIVLTLFIFNITVLAQNTTTSKEASPKNIEKTIFVCGATMVSINQEMTQKYIKYVAELTKKVKPKICFIPTATYDNPLNIIKWYEYCATINVVPSVLKTFVESDPKQLTFEEQLMDCDAIIVAGGSTINMLAIWKAHGIDTVLRNAYDKGIILAGGNAGSLCWFTGGLTDSRPKYLSQVECLGFLNYSNCPHYGNANRKVLHKEAILNHKLKEGYGSDNYAGLLFINGVLKKSVSLDKDNYNYFLSEKDGEINEELLQAEIINSRKAAAYSRLNRLRILW